MYVNYNTLDEELIKQYSNFYYSLGVDGSNDQWVTIDITDPNQATKLTHAPNGEPLPESSGTWYSIELHNLKPNQNYQFKYSMIGPETDVMNYGQFSTTSYYPSVNGYTNKGDNMDITIKQAPKPWAYEFSYDIVKEGDSLSYMEMYKEKRLTGKVTYEPQGTVSLKEFSNGSYGNVLTKITVTEDWKGNKLDTLNEKYSIVLSVPIKNPETNEILFYIPIGKFVLV